MGDDPPRRTRHQSRLERHRGHAVCEAALAQSGSAARRLIQQGGVYLNGNRIESVDYIVGSNDIENDEILLKAGKKKIHKIKIIPRTISTTTLEGYIYVIDSLWLIQKMDLTMEKGNLLVYDYFSIPMAMIKVDRN